MNDDHETYSDTDEFECPYCGYKNYVEGEDMGSYIEDEDDVHCGGCGKTFRGSVSISYSFTAKVMPCTMHNYNEWSEWRPSKSIKDPDRSFRYRDCKDCAEGEGEFSEGAPIL